MKCGDLGHRNKQGNPCDQNINPRMPGCLWHRRSPEERRALAAAGALVSGMRRALPKGHRVDFTDRAAVLQFVQDLTQRGLTDNVDPKRIELGFKGAQVALTAFAQEATEKLAEALLRLEHGGMAAVLLAKLGDGVKTGARRPLPGLGRKRVPLDPLNGRTEDEARSDDRGSG